MYQGRDGMWRRADADDAEQVEVLEVTAVPAQDAQAAGFAAHIPGLAAAQVVKQRLIVPLHDDADVADTGVHH